MSEFNTVQDQSPVPSKSVSENVNEKTTITDSTNNNLVQNNQSTKETDLFKRIIQTIAPITSAASFPVIAAGLVVALTTAAPLGVGIAIVGVGITILAIAVSVMIITQQIHNKAHNQVQDGEK